MSNIWVCKPDQTIQCEESDEITLEEMREELALLIGESNIINMQKKSVVMIQLCGAPTGNMNAYEITQAGWHILNRGIVGPQGFTACPDCSSKDAVSFGQMISTFASSNPTMIRELIGHPVRVYETGDALTKDYRPNRVNIEVDSDNNIVQIWFG